MRATEFITELFAPKQQTWEWNFRGSEEAAADFKVGEVPYRFHAYSNDSNDWEVEFKIKSTGDTRQTFKSKFGLTKTGNSTEVMSTVVDIMREFLQIYHGKIDTIGFTAEEPSRQKLYMRMMKRLLPNWVINTYDAGKGALGFTVVAPDNLEEEITDEMALKQFTPMGDFNKPGPFKGVDKRLVPHPTNQMKTQKFFEQTPYDFRLFFSNIPGTGKYSETGPVSSEQLQQMFGEQAQPIIKGSEDAITVVFVGNTGDSKVMMTPWIMAHRFGHAIQAGARRNRGWHTWIEAEKHFFTAVNTMLEQYYGKQSPSRMGATPNSMRGDLTPEYNALFNAIGTQRSSRSGEIRRPYEFLYEIFAQYLGTGQVSFNPLPSNLGYGRKNWGNPSRYMNIKPELRDEAADATQTLANDMQYMFDDVLSSTVGQILVM